MSDNDITAAFSKFLLMSEKYSDLLPETQINDILDVALAVPATNPRYTGMASGRFETVLPLAPQFTDAQWRRIERYINQTDNPFEAINLLYSKHPENMLNAEEYVVACLEAGDDSRFQPCLDFYPTAAALDALAILLRNQSVVDMLLLTKLFSMAIDLVIPQRSITPENNPIIREAAATVILEIYRLDMRGGLQLPLLEVLFDGIAWNEYGDVNVMLDALLEVRAWPKELLRKNREKALIGIFHGEDFETMSEMFERICDEDPDPQELLEVFSKVSLDYSSVLFVGMFLQFMETIKSMSVFDLVWSDRSSLFWRRLFPEVDRCVDSEYPDIRDKALALLNDHKEE